MARRTVADPGSGVLQVPRFARIDENGGYFVSRLKTNAFRELKTLYDLDEFDTTNPAVVEILLYAAILTLVVSRKLLELVIEHADDEAVFPPERWAATESDLRKG